MNLYRPSAMALLATALAFALAACSDKEQTTQTLEPVAFHASDECHVCGMIIADSNFTISGSNMWAQR